MSCPPPTHASYGISAQDTANLIKKFNIHTFKEWKIHFIELKRYKYVAVPYATQTMTKRYTIVMAVRIL